MSIEHVDVISRKCVDSKGYEQKDHSWTRPRDSSTFECTNCDETYERGNGKLLYKEDLEHYSDEALRAEISRRENHGLRRAKFNNMSNSISANIRAFNDLTEAEAAELNTIIGIEIDKVTVKPICDHEWGRHPYTTDKYSCTKCGVYKQTVYLIQTAKAKCCEHKVSVLQFCKRCDDQLNLEIAEAEIENHR